MTRLLIAVLESPDAEARWSACAHLRCRRAREALGPLERLVADPPDDMTGKLASRAVASILHAINYEIGDGRC